MTDQKPVTNQQLPENRIEVESEFGSTLANGSFNDEPLSSENAQQIVKEWHQGSKNIIIVSFKWSPALINEAGLKEYIITDVLPENFKIEPDFEVKIENPPNA